MDTVTVNYRCIIIYNTENEKIAKNIDTNCQRKRRTIVALPVFNAIVKICRLVYYINQSIFSKTAIVQVIFHSRNVSILFSVLSTTDDKTSFCCQVTM